MPLDQSRCQTGAASDLLGRLSLSYKSDDFVLDRRQECCFSVFHGRENGDACETVPQTVRLCRRSWAWLLILRRLHLGVRHALARYASSGGLLVEIFSHLTQRGRSDTVGDTGSEATAPCRLLTQKGRVLALLHVGALTICAGLLLYTD